MKLYRGIKSKDLNPFNAKTSKAFAEVFAELLKRRERGDFSYPKKFDKEIQTLEKVGRYRRQNFTDDRKIAQAYAKANNGTLVEISVPIKEITKSFHIEFQNFGKRRSKFEIVYVVDSVTLFKNSRKWKMRLKR
jgi:hypothetical protein